MPWAAGGGADTACRLICSYIERELGCTIVINNVTGGGGSIGLAQLTKANTDGLSYAYFANTDSNGDIMLEGVPYTAEDFAPVCKFAADPHIIVTSNGIRYQGYGWADCSRPGWNDSVGNRRSMDSLGFRKTGIPGGYRNEL